MLCVFAWMLPGSRDNPLSPSDLENPASGYRQPAPRNNEVNRDRKTRAHAVNAITNAETAGSRQRSEALSEYNIQVSEMKMALKPISAGPVYTGHHFAGYTRVECRWAQVCVRDTCMIITAGGGNL